MNDKYVCLRCGKDKLDYSDMSKKLIVFDCSILIVMLNVQEYEVVDDEILICKECYNEMKKKAGIK